MGIFKRPKVPDLPKVEPTPPPVAPTIDTSVKIREEEDNQRRKRRRGRAATLLTGSGGAGAPVTATKTLLGS